MTPPSLLAGTVLAVVALAGCADDGPVASPADIADSSAPADVARPVVTISRSRFSDREIRVHVGTTVVWRNDDPFAHTVTSVEGSAVAFDSGELALGDTFEMTFAEPGTFAYFCRIHPTMRARVIVV